MSELDYKNTLNLPVTDFPMKANLAQREPTILEHWNHLCLYQKLQQQWRERPKFILNDGPPYANGEIHIGHAVNKILKDFIIKSKILSGYQVPYVPGWDCHGLPIEHQVEKKMGKAGHTIDGKTFRHHCREFATKQIALQKASFIRLGVIGDWEHPYLTMDYQYEANTIRALAKIIEKGHLQRGDKPVHWCMDCRSALAEAEIEYIEKTSPAIDVRFSVIDEQTVTHPFSKIPGQGPLSVVIWTTTPWTLPANEAVALHADYHYTLVQTDTERLIIASDLVDSCMARYQMAHFTILATCQGNQLEGVLLQHPLYQKVVPIILGDHVTLETGTGCVHTAPAHGAEDHVVGQKYHLPVVNPVNAHGCFTEDTPLFAGQFVFKANTTILETLKSHHRLIHQETIEHSYPHCWRHKTPTIFRATPQWFISMENQRLREQALQAIKAVAWIPDWGQTRIERMIIDRPDWCISRQRNWGVPLCLFIHKETGNLHPNTVTLMETVAAQVEKSGIDAWYDLDPKTLLGPEADTYQKTQDILDVWFDSGVAHFCVLDQNTELSSPADLYLEGSDQHRGWFQSSLLTSIAMKEVAPYQTVLTHGFTVDAKGHKMSKSQGNAVSPQEIVSSLGADVLRLWIAATDYKNEIVVSQDILKQTADIYRRVRNTARFLLANLAGFEFTQHAIPIDELLVLDRWILKRAKQLQAEIIQHYADFQFHLVYQKIHHFCSIELGSFYLDIIKDRQYTGKKEGLPRRSAQTTMYYLIEALVRWIAPILSFTAEEIWQYLPKQADSVFLSEWYQFPQISNDDLDDDFWQTIMAVRDCVNKALEAARAEQHIGSSLEAEVTLYCQTELYHTLTLLEDELRFVLITSYATVLPTSNMPPHAKPTDKDNLWLTIQPTTHAKCVRCWHRRESVNAHSDYPNICDRCVENIQGAGEKRHYA